MTKNVSALADDTDLKPELVQHPLDGKPETQLNADAMVSLMKNTDTDAARHFYRAYRKRKAELKRDNPGLDDATLRQRALLDVMPVTHV